MTVLREASERGDPVHEVADALRLLFPGQDFHAENQGSYLRS
jgi:hypothetical protein